MARGETVQARVHYKGADEDFLVFVDDVNDYRKWLNDTSVPLAHFVSSFKVFTTHRQGVQGTMNEAGNGALDNEFNTHIVEDVIQKILKNGTLQESEFPERLGIRNDSQGPRGGHY